MVGSADGAAAWPGTPAGVLPAGVHRVADAVVMGPPGGAQDRFRIDADLTGGRLSLVEHLLGPRVLAGPMHRHTREDELSVVLEGEVGAVLGGEVVHAGPGDVLTKPRGQWHTFWNAGDAPARILEIITPGGLEELFRRFGDDGLPEPEELMRLAAAFGCEIDPEATAAVVAEHGLRG
jgi:mannose-6-phosphate isomerase-like protein (cupin superfamily)